jgi:hypothetical protein
MNTRVRAVTSQLQLARSIWLSITMMAMSTLMLIAAVLSLVAHAPAVGETFLAFMIIFGASGFTSSVISSNRARSFAQARQPERRADLDGTFRGSPT